MNETLRLLYDKFYTPLPMVESEQEVEICHRQLIERLDKPERELGGGAVSGEEGADNIGSVEAAGKRLRATLRGQLYLRIPSGVGNGKRTESF